jgi:hypothetical protein
MTPPSLPSIDFSRKQHLAVLRRLDAHPWNTLRDLRRCQACGDVFTGSEIEIVGGTRAYGPLRLRCPGRDCAAGPQQWEPVLRSAPASDSTTSTGPVLVTHRGRVYRVQRIKRAVPAERTNTSGVWALAATLARAALRHSTGWIHLLRGPLLRAGAHPQP